MTTRRFSGPVTMAGYLRKIKNELTHKPALTWLIADYAKSLAHLAFFFYPSLREDA